MAKGQKSGTGSSFRSLLDRLDEQVNKDQSEQRVTAPPPPPPRNVVSMTAAGPSIVSRSAPTAVPRPEPSPAPRPAPTAAVVQEDEEPLNLDSAEFIDSVAPPPLTPPPKLAAPQVAALPKVPASEFPPIVPVHPQEPLVPLEPRRLTPRQEQRGSFLGRGYGPLVGGLVGGIAAGLPVMWLTLTWLDSSRNARPTPVSSEPAIAPRTVRTVQVTNSEGAVAERAKVAERVEPTQPMSARIELSAATTSSGSASGQPVPPAPVTPPPAAAAPAPIAPAPQPVTRAPDPIAPAPEPVTRTPPASAPAPSPATASVAATAPVAVSPPTASPSLQEPRVAMRVEPPPPPAPRLIAITDIRLAAGSVAEMSLRVDPVPSGGRAMRVVVAGLPPGATLSPARQLGSGAWSVATGDLDGLRIEVPKSVAAREASLAFELQDETGNAVARARTRLQIVAIAPVAALSAGEVSSLIARGEELMSRGDISSARLVLRRAADGGSGHAALMLGRSYDPRQLARLSVFGVVGDVKSARHWYQLAADLGMPDASRLLDQLPSK
jgi:hypothetical protein